jgi:glycosyltransferase involved in cell wall biosynthesis
MRILEINKFNHVRGGADKHFLDLVKLLQSKGEEVAVFSMYHPENRESQWSKYFVSRVDYEKGSFFNKLKGVWRVFWSFEARRKISALLDEFQPDIVHIHNIYHQISPSILPEIKKRQIPVAMTVHDWKLICPNYLLNCEEPYCRKCVSGKYWHCLAKRCVKKSYLKSLLGALEVSFHRWLKIYEKNIDLFLAPSQFVKDILIQAHFPAEKIKVLPHFAHRRGLTSTKGREGYAVYFGRVSKEKNVDELIEIFKDLPTQLVLAGNKDSDFEVPNYPNIKYVGFKRASELEKIIQNSKFVVSASRLPETFGLIALEAIENNKPFLGYKVGAYPEIIKNNENGYLAENRSEFKEKVVQYARGEVPQFNFSGEKFNPERYGEKIIDIFRSLC